MRHLRSPRRLIRRSAVTLLRPVVGAALLCLSLAGCPQPQQQQNINSADVGNNATISTAAALAFDAAESVTFSGTASSPLDVDVYQLNTLNPGDRVFIDVLGGSAQLDLIAAVFDERGNLYAFNDDRAADSSNLNPLIDLVVRGPAGPFFLAIAPLDGSTVTGDYQVTVDIQRGVGIPSPRPQIVFLDWRGGSGVRVPNVGTFTLPPFDAAQVGLSSTLTDDLKQRVQEIVADRYKGFGLDLRNSDDHPQPVEAHSTVYYGGSSSTAFAISEQIDSYNADAADDAIVFTGAFRDAFRLNSPNFEEMAQALGNTTAHELGHLLGLVHTASCNELMDTTCGNSRILNPQTFGNAALDTSVFAFGFQNAPQILAWILGLQ